MRTVIAAFLFALSLTALAQNTSIQQLTQVPPKPTCNPAALGIFGGGPDCQDRWNLYNQAVQTRQREELQLYVQRQQEQAAAPLQQQIMQLNKLSADQQAQIKKLQEQIQSDSAAALQAEAEAHKQGIEKGVGIGATAMLVISAVVFAVIRKQGSSKPQARAASA